MKYKDFWSKIYSNTGQKKLLQEHNCYKLIPGTRNSFREDPMDTSTLTDRHSHVYAKPDGGGKQIYAVNFDGSGHDGSSGKEIPQTHADYFRSKGYTIPLTNIIECITMDQLNGSSHQILFG